jgi:hypothetical protein
MAWKGVDGDQGIYWSRWPVEWAPQRNVGAVGTSVGPALATFNNRLYMAWKGVDGDQGIYWSEVDRNNWV